MNYIKKLIANLLSSTATVTANGTATYYSMWFFYQPKEPKSLRDKY